MKKINLVSVALSILLFSGCRKDDKTIYTVSGHFYHDCNMEPVINSKVILFENAENGRGDGGELATTYTDSTGYFKFEYQDKKGIDLIFRISAGAGYSNILEGIPVRTSIDNLVVFNSHTTNIHINLNVTNPYTSNDTLFITDFNNLNQKLSVVGPFTSGLLYSANNFPILDMNYNSNPVNMGYKTASANWIIKTIDLKVCDATNVTIDIN